MANSITVCVNYSDILAITLPNNAKHFDRTVVITDSQDTQTMDLVNSIPNCELFITDSFYDNGAKFNKGLAMEQGLDYMGRQGWICIWDADIVMPTNLDLSQCKIGNLYSPNRRILENIKGISLSSIGDISQYPVYPESEFAGYFQYFHADDSVLKELPWYGVDWNHAGGCDSDFQRKWDNNHKIRLNTHVLHLGAPGVNWNGRATDLVDGTRTQEMDNNWRKQQQMMNKRKLSHSYEDEKVKPIVEELQDYSYLKEKTILKDVGVVIPNYNYAEFIREAIDSVLEQTMLPAQIVIVDDCSTDHSVKIITKHIENIQNYYPDIMLRTTPINSGGGEARNIGINNMPKEIRYIVCLDADDKLPTNYLEVCHHEIVSNDMDIVYTNALLFGDFEGVLEVPKFNALTFRCKNLINVTAMFKRDLSDGFDKDLRNNMEDYEHWFSMFAKGARIMKTEHTWIHYRKHGETEIVKACKRMLDIKAYMRKKYPNLYLG